MQASQSAGRFEAGTLGFQGPSAGESAFVALPSGTKVVLPWASSQHRFTITITNDTLTALDAAYPAGRYNVALSSSILSFTNGAVLPTDNFPTAPHFNNYAAAQQIDSRQGFDLVFEPFVATSTAAGHVTS